MATERYFEAVGRRKTATVRVRITPTSKESITVNDKTLPDYFQTQNLQDIVHSGFKASGIQQKFVVTVKAMGGGIHAIARDRRVCEQHFFDLLLSR